MLVALVDVTIVITVLDFCYFNFFSSPMLGSDKQHPTIIYFSGLTLQLNMPERLF